MQSETERGSESRSVFPLSPGLCQDVSAKTSPFPPPSSSLKYTKWIIHRSRFCLTHVGSELESFFIPLGVGQRIKHEPRLVDVWQHTARLPDTEEDQRSDAQRPLLDKRRDRRQESRNDKCNFRVGFQNKARWWTLTSSEQYECRSECKK